MKGLIARRWAKELAAGALAAVLLTVGPAPMHSASAQDFASVPKAECGPDDVPEIVQGQVTMAERFARTPAHSVQCNLRLAGQYKGEGAGWGLLTVGDCAYVSTVLNNQREPKLLQPGVAVVDTSDSGNPRLVGTLDSPAMLNVNESLDYHAGTGILLGGISLTFNQEKELPLDVYRVSGCGQQQLLSSVLLEGVRVHGGAFSPDGKLYFGASCCGPNANGGPDSAVYVIDLSDPAQPKEIGRWLPENSAWKTHWLSVSEDGTRAYISLIETVVDGPNDNGIVILDISDFTTGKADPEFRIVSSLLWKDTQFGEYNDNFVKDGRRYLIHTDMSGALSFGGGVFAPSACTAGRPNWGFGRIIDVTDEAAPVLVSDLSLEVDDPARCHEVIYDPTQSGGYSSAFCDLDSRVDPKMLACGYMEGGLRVFDIRDIASPKEIAYYKPPATGSVPSPASFHLVGYPMPFNTADSVVVPYFHDGGREIRFNAMENGFMAVRFSDSFMEANPALFSN
jgi:hypothetical protein